ncbi:hypothetical protein [Empedobacter brevis]|uniref:hypothetical protein n=1 Tax=Empedobacter brevis TaxID=247 RepID=UPI0028AF8117|nr:hypothetical protein [Empedobacter brevis]
MLKKYDNICETIKTKPLKGIFFFILLFFFFIQNTVAQTLSKGDIVVVGVNGLATCTGYPSYNGFSTRDAIFILAINDISDGAILDITDNAWQRKQGYDNNFAKTEGALRFIRNGGRINRGTVFQLNIIDGYLYTTKNNTINNYNTALTKVNNGWKVESINNVKNVTKGFDVGSGDQVLFMSGGIWDDKTTSNPNATYSSSDANVIFGFNSKVLWKNYGDDSNHSGLPGDELNDPFDIRLHHYTSNLKFEKSTDKKIQLQYYNGPWNETSIKEWYMRFLNPSNWDAATDCTSFIKNLDKSPISILTENSEKIVCKDDNLTINVDDNSIVSYQWYRNNTNTSSGGTIITGATSFSYDPPTDVVGTQYYYCVMRYKLTWNIKTNELNSKTSEIIESLPFKVTVNPLPKIAPIEMN